MRLLVTGGCGFIGSNFIRDMLTRHEELTVINLDKLTYAGNRQSLADVEARYGGTRYTFVQGDIANSELVRHLLPTHAVEAVVNFAAESHVDRSITDATPFVTTNVVGTQCLLDASRQGGIRRFVQVSTDEVYGSLGPTGKFTEETRLAPNSPYAASKAAADLLVRAAHATYGLDTIITRCSNNYGPYQFPEKLIPLMFSRAMADEPLPVYGDGQHVRDWIYVLDHCRGIELALTKGQAGAVYNFGGNAEKTNLMVVRTLLASLGKPESLIRFVADRPGHDRRYAMDFGKAARELGFAPAYDFSRGMDATMHWYRQHGDWLENVKSGAYRQFMDIWYGGRA